MYVEYKRGELDGPGTDQISGTGVRLFEMLEVLNLEGSCGLSLPGGFAQKVTKAFFSVQPLCSLCLCG